MTLNEQLVTGVHLEMEVPSADDTKKSEKFHVVIDKPFKDGILTVTAPMKQGRIIPIQKNTIIKIVFPVTTGKSTDAFSATCRVTDRLKSGNFNTMSLELSSSPKKVQRRAYFRFSIVKKIHFVYDSQKYEMLTKNISATGARGISDKKIPDGELCVIYLPLDDELLNLRAEVVFSSLSQDSRYKSDLRFRFVGISEKDKSKITHFIFKQQSDMVRKNLDESGLNRGYGIDHDRPEFGEVQVDIKEYMPPFSWAIAIIIVGLFLRARPEKMNGLDKFWGYLRDNTWNEFYLNIMAIVCLGQLIFCAFGFFIQRRKGQSNNLSFMVNGAISIILLVMYVFLYNLT